jgi:hypothetical protein
MTEEAKRWWRHWLTCSRCTRFHMPRIDVCMAGAPLWARWVMGTGVRPEEYRE